MPVAGTVGGPSDTPHKAPVECGDQRPVCVSKATGTWKPVKAEVAGVSISGGMGGTTPCIAASIEYIMERKQWHFVHLNKNAAAVAAKEESTKVVLTGKSGTVPERMKVGQLFHGYCTQHGIDHEQALPRNFMVDFLNNYSRPMEQDTL